MESRRTFGRRAASQPSAPCAVTPALVQPIISCPPSEATLPSVEDEIEAWKAARISVVAFPWRQFSLMAGLCFGIASFVLPDTVNAAMQWPLYALTAISLYAGLRKRKTKSR
jgi:hypothetical protein